MTLTNQSPTSTNQSPTLTNQSTTDSSPTLTNSSQSLPLLILKFGGTSVGSVERIIRVCHIIKNSMSTHRVIVVCSAISSGIKRQGTTSRYDYLLL